MGVWLPPELEITRALRGQLLAPGVKPTYPARLSRAFGEGWMWLLDSATNNPAVSGRSAPTLVDWDTGTPGLLIDEVGRSVNVSTTTSELRTETHFLHGIGTGDFTVFAHIQVDGTLDLWEGVLANGDFSPGLLYANLGSGINKWGAYYGANFAANTQLTSGNRYVLSISRVGTTLSFYLNGVADGTATNANIDDSIANNFLVVGNSTYNTGNTNQFQAGRIYSVGVIKRWLSAEEHQSLGKDLYCWALEPANQTPYLLTVPAGGGTEQAIDPALSTDAAQAFSKRKLKSISAATETDASQTLQPSTRREIGHAAESNAALSLSTAKSKSISFAAETGSAVSISTTAGLEIGIATESNAAQSVSKAKQRGLSNATETDAAQAIGVSKYRTIGHAAETSAAQSLSIQKRLSLTSATEADTARPITEPGATPVAPTLESDVAQSFTWTKRRAIGAATETQIASGIGMGRGYTINPALETNTPISISRVKSRSVGVATTTDAAQAITTAGPIQVAVGTATETNTAVSITAPTVEVEQTAWDIAANRAVDTAYRIFGKPATYIDLQDTETSCTAIVTTDPDVMLAGADYGVRGRDISIRIRKSEVSSMYKNATVIVGTTTYNVDGYDHLSQYEWRIDGRS